MKTPLRLLPAVLAAGFVLGSALSTSAQTFYLNPIPETTTTFGLRFMHAHVKGSLDPSTFSGTYDFYLKVPVSEGLVFDFSLPYSSVSYFPGPDLYGMPRSKIEQRSLGNLYFGMHMTNQRSERTKSVLSIGFHLPTSSAKITNIEAISYGLLANLHQARRALPNTWTVYSSMAWWMETSRGNSFGGEFGAEAWVPVDGFNFDPDLFLRSGFSASGRSRHFSFTTELMGLFMATGKADNLSDRLESHLAFGIGLRNYNVRPSLWYQIPLDDDISRVVDGVIGFQIEVSMP